MSQDLGNQFPVASGDLLGTLPGAQPPRTDCGLETDIAESCVTGPGIFGIQSSRFSGGVDVCDDVMNDVAISGAHVQLLPRNDPSRRCRE